jgi:hypothetical protein
LRAAIHQPHYFPYPGFFNKLSMVDVLVVMDATQYDKRFTNRNRILDPHGEVWLTVPIHKEDRFSPNRQVRINEAIPWRADHWRKILVSYANAKYFNLYKEELKEFYDTVWPNLFDLDLGTTRKTMEWLGIDIPVVLESELHVSSTGSQRLLDICKSIGADTYVSGRGGSEYIDLRLFEENDVAVEFQEYSASPYPQRFTSEFVPDLSVLDLISNVGPGSAELVRSTPKLSELRVG